MRLGRSFSLLVPTVGLLLAEAPASAQPASACSTPKTTCGGDGGYYAPSEDVGRVTAVVDPLLRELRTCLDAAGGKHVDPAIVIRWDAEGHAVSVKVEAPGYDSLPCVAKASGKASQLQNPHETAIRCDYGCGRPAPPAAPPVAPPPVTPPPAATQAPPAPPAPAPTPVKPYVTKETWYGYQTLIADAVVSGLFVGAFTNGGRGFWYSAIGGFLLATPVIHGVHHNVGPGFASFAIRLVMPWVTALIGGIAGAVIGSGEGEGDLEKVGSGATGLVNGLVIGLGVGALGAVAIDAFGFAYEKELVPQASLRPTPRRLSLSPILDIRREGGGSVGIGGRF